MKWLANSKIGTRLLVSFIFVSLLAGIVGTIGTFSIIGIKNDDTKLYVKMTAPLGQLMTVVDSYQRMRGNVRDILLAGTEAQVADFESRIKDRDAEFDTNLQKIADTLLTDEGKALVTTVEADKAEYDKTIQQVLVYEEAGKHKQAVELLYGDAETIRTKLETAFNQLKQMKIDIAKTTSDNNTKAAMTAVILMIIIALVSMAMAILLGLYISKSIEKPIKKLIVAAHKIAGGDLDVAIDTSANDEIGELSKAFDQMTNTVNEILININSASEQVAAGSRQLSDSSVSLSKGATEQASSIEELTSSLEEIASQTTQNAENAKEANELSSATKENAELGNAKMQQMLLSMNEISASSKKISGIIKVIDEIAFQTNILSLNAAVEAARAGQHGMGFAVVAEEVRNLAIRCADAAKETTEMIESSLEKVTEGTAVAKQTAEALSEIVGDIGNAARLVNEIAQSSGEQAAAIEQVNQGVMQVSQVIQNNSSNAEESAAASEELASQANVLRDQVARFKLKVTQKLSTAEFHPDLQWILENISTLKKFIPISEIEEKTDHKIIPEISLAMGSSKYE